MQFTSTALLAVLGLSTQVFSAPTVESVEVRATTPTLPTANFGLLQTDLASIAAAVTVDLNAIYLAGKNSLGDITVQIEAAITADLNDIILQVENAAKLIITTTANTAFSLLDIGAVLELVISVSAIIGEITLSLDTAIGFLVKATIQVFSSELQALYAALTSLASPVVTYVQALAGIGPLLETDLADLQAAVTAFSTFLLSVGISTNTAS